MSGGMGRRDRAIVAGLVCALAYGLAAALWFMDREGAIAKAEKGYQGAKKQLAAEKKLVKQRGDWEARLAEDSGKIPTVGLEESTQTRWQRIMERIAAENHVRLVSEQPGQEEDHGDLYELPIEVRYEAALEKLVAFLHALNVAEGAMFDVRRINVTSRNNGFLTGNFTLTCAYMRGEVEEAEEKAKAKEEAEPAAAETAGAGQAADGESKGGEK